MHDDKPRVAPTRLLLESLVDEGELPLARARDHRPDPAFLRDLEADGIADVEEVTVVRDPLAGRIFPTGSRRR